MFPPLPRHLLAALMALALPARAEFSAEKLALVDRPYQAGRAALSPDGKHLAFTSGDDGKLDLQILNLDRKSRIAVPLSNTAETNRILRLSELRWVNSDRLLLVSSDAEIISIDARGQNAMGLWDRNDAGLVNDLEFAKEKFAVRAGLPRLLPLSDRPDSVLIESTALIGGEKFGNAFLVDAVTGAAELVDKRAYFAYQIALYGRGDMLLWPPIDHAVGLYTTPQGHGPVGLIDLHRYFTGGGVREGDVSTPGTFPLGDPIIESPWMTRTTLERFMAFPPADPEYDDGQMHFNWPAPKRDYGGKAPKLPPPTYLTPETGAAVRPDTSASGRMLYDRQGRPRLLYTEDTKGGPRTYLYTAPGQRVFDPYGRPKSLASFLGQTQNGEFSLTVSNYFGERSYPLGFDHDPNVLYFASNVGRDTFGIYSLNLETRERKEVAVDPAVDLASGDPSDTDDLLVFDEKRRALVGVRYTALRRVTRWLDPELGEIQASLNARLPRHAVEILAWDEDRRRFLLQVSNESDPGALFVFDRPSDSLDLMTSRTPWLVDTSLNSSTGFAFRTPSGQLLSGYLTLPDQPKINPPPLLIYCPAGLWGRALPGFNREAEMIADMGFAVLRLNYRGVAGFGRAHLTAIQQGIDTIPPADLVAAVDFLAASRRVDRSRIVVMGEGFGGYVAQRAVQLHPDLFRGAISINAPTNLSLWARPQDLPVASMYRDGSPERGGTIDFRSEVRARFVAEARKQSADAPRRPEGVRDRPMLVIEGTDTNDTTPLMSAMASLGLGLQGLDVGHLRIPGGFETGTFRVREIVFRRIEAFLNTVLYNFEVEAGELKEIERGSAAGARK